MCVCVSVCVCVCMRVIGFAMGLGPSPRIATEDRNARVLARHAAVVAATQQYQCNAAKLTTVDVLMRGGRMRCCFTRPCCSLFTAVCRDQSRKARGYRETSTIFSAVDKGKGQLNPKILAMETKASIAEGKVAVVCLHKINHPGLSTQ